MCIRMDTWDTKVKIYLSVCLSVCLSVSIHMIYFPFTSNIYIMSNLTQQDHYGPAAAYLSVCLSVCLSAVCLSVNKVNDFVVCKD